MIGPVTIDENDLRVNVEVSQEIAPGSGKRYQRWSFVTVELLDENKKYLSSFGGELWHYAVSNGSHWVEEDEEYEAVIEVPSSGTYYLRIQTECNVDPAALSEVWVEMSETGWGRPAPFQLAGHVTFFLGIILVVAASNWGIWTPELEEGLTLRVRGRSWIVRGRADYVYDDWHSEEWTLHGTDPEVKRPRYLECEYEVDSSWEAWFWSTPLAIDDLEAKVEGDKTSVTWYAQTQGTLPDTIVYKGRRLPLDDSGTTRRDGDSRSYYTYKTSRRDDGRSITIEGDPHGELSAVVSESIAVSEIEVEEQA